ncbi:MAG: 23S rRNA (uracil(1939)-C(5))-methyltransferase RlmD, partial [Oscillospiraceae bacterium]|nr:23S rRNA (uracil(1939)-C(5))-methyltransferase RlmD [Oscillospiraceae bacterium]
MQKNDIFTAVMDGVTSEGHGVCRHEGRAVFVPGALVGEEWEVRVVKCAANAVWGRGERRLSASPERVVPRCAAAGRCGGCTLQHMSYAAELAFKKQRVNDAFRRIGGLDFAIEEILGAPEDARQRCKAIFNVGLSREGKPMAGFYRPRSHEIVSAPDCTLVRPEALRAAEAVLAWMEAVDFPVHDELKNKQGLRHIFVRSSRATGKTVVTLISSRNIDDAAPLKERLHAAVPEMSGLVWCLNRQKGNVVLAGDFRTLWGSDTLTETLCGIPFELSPRSFFQVNPPQAEKLYEAAVAYALEKDPELVMDLYCGTGTIGLCMAKGGARRVIGVEVIAAAVENARANAGRLGFENTEFLCADAAEAAAELARRGERPGAVVVDPPRKGLDSAVIDSVAGMCPERVVYVSCDPGTLARDLALFVKHGYAPQKGLAVDMFPRTPHVETVCLLSKLNTKQHIEINLDMDELDLTDAEKKATYQEIKDYVLEHSGLKVSSLYVAQVKQQCGIIERENYNKPKSEDAKQPQCPP